VAISNIITLSTERKRVVVTGCTRGLGRALVEGFANRGDLVAGCGRTNKALRALARQIGPAHHLFQADVVDDAAVAAFRDRVIDEIGVPNLVINNAAVINHSAPIWDVSAEEFDEVMRINVGGTAAILRHFLPPMIEAGEPAVIVNFSSGWGRSTSPEVAPYCASKWAIEGLTQAVAQEVPSFIGVIAFNPGIIHTEMLESCFGRTAASYPEPDDWARSAVPFLANLRPSDNGKALTSP
jgi:NAD(P)-dependent dehydrogenase (short-subunit alcohol dehydrogenase family)